MDPDRWREVDRLFEAALEKSGEELRLWLAGADSGLRAEVEQLLAADRGARSFLEREVWRTGGGPAAGAAGDLPPSRFGAYEVLGVLGEGGMGRVYLAARADQQYQRKVAIKTLRANPLEPRREEMLARFELERQALAQLEHPNIARLYDAGRDDSGDPYLVLEHVDGAPIDAYCDQHLLGVEARLELFLEVCRAVEAAHRNLLVHRDLKPSNILVRKGGQPVLLDFGIAKLLDPGRKGELLLTRPGSRPMTPGYASPEQVRGEPITTASDVYSLGVLLYELLAGRKPYPITSWQPHELERAICEIEPEKPSTAVFRQPPAGGSGLPPALSAQEIARRRGSSPGELAFRLRGDLDCLLQKALRKEPQRRYESVEAFGRDLRAYLGGRPLAARPESRLYTLRKFAGRHRGATAAAAALAALLASFLAALAFQAREIRAERDQARQTLAFLIDVFEAADPARARGEDPPAREILGGAAGRVERELAGQPGIQATLMDAVGQIYFGLGLYAEAESLFARSLERRPDEAGEEARLTRIRWQNARAAAAKP